jgi:esterase/lipase superfamily enzyme
MISVIMRSRTEGGGIVTASDPRNRVLFSSAFQPDRILALILVLSTTLSACASSTRSSAKPEDKYDKYHRVSVFYGTDRRATGSQVPTNFFGAELGDLQFGTCAVSIPFDHRVGTLETPYFRYFENPEKHIVLLSVTPKGQAQFLSELRTQVQISPKSTAFVFIHGFNVSFEDACRRTGQLAYDLKFPGAPIMWSWPSNGSTAAYLSDETKVEWTTPHLSTFLTLVKEQSGAQKLHLIAHSMGSRAMVRALAKIAADLQSRDEPLFSQIVLTAPDIDATLFRQLVAIITKTSTRTTLYASSTDEAMRASRLVHGDLPRAGEAGPYLLHIDGVDTVDASGVDTSFIKHSYFADKASVVSDLYDLFLTLKPPDERFFLEEIKQNGLRHWQFRK